MTGARAQETWAPAIVFDGINKTVNGVTSPIPNGPVATADPVIANWDYATYGNPPFLFPNGFTENPITNEWIVVDTYHGRLLRFATDHHPPLEAGTFIGQVPTAIGGTPTFPYQPVIDDQGTILVPDISAGAIRAFVPNGGGYDGYTIDSFIDAVTDPLHPTTVPFNSPYRIAFLSDPAGGMNVTAGIGSLFVLDAGANKVYKLSLTGGVASPTWSLQLSFGESAQDCACAGPAIFDYPTGLALDAAGNIYVSDPNNTTAVTIQVFNPAGQQIQVISQGLSFPWSMSIAADGRLFVADSGNNRIAVFSKYDAASPGSSLSPVTARIGSASQPLGGLYLPSGPNPPGPPGELQEPTSIAFDQFGRLLVADTDNARMQIFDRAHLSVAAIAVPQTVDFLSQSVDVRVAVTLPDGENAMTNVSPGVPSVSFSEAGGPGSAVVDTTPSCIITPASTAATDCQPLTGFPLAPGGQLLFTFRFDKVPAAVGPAWFSVIATGLDESGAPVSSATVQTYAVAIDGTPPSNPPITTATFDLSNDPPSHNWFKTQPVLVDLAATLPSAADGVVQEIEYNFGPVPPEEGEFYVCFNVYSSDHPDDASCVVPIYKTGTTTLWYRSLSSRGLYDALVPYGPDPSVSVPGWSSLDVNLDFSGPVVGFGSTATGANGWYNQVPMIVNFTAVDTESLLDTVDVTTTGGLNATVTNNVTPNTAVGTGTLTFNTEGSGAATLVMTDRAGNISTVVQPFRIDATDPSIDVTPLVTSATSLVDIGGTTWSRSPITATFGATDDRSGFDVEMTLTTNCVVTVTSGTGQTRTCTVYDQAGNEASRLAGPFSIDLDPPTVAVSYERLDGTPMSPPSIGGALWFNGPFRVRFTATDAGIGFSDPTIQLTDTRVFAVSTSAAIITTFTDLFDHSTTATAGPFMFDTTRPSLTVVNIIAGADTPIASPTTAVVAYAGVSATDNVDPSPTVSCSPVSGTAFAFGVTKVSCTATDAVGNATTQSFTVTVEDRTAPVLTVPVAVSQFAAEPTEVTFAVSATDNLDPHPTIVCSPASGSVFFLGTTTVICTATDASGNVASKSFSVTLVAHSAPVCTDAVASPGELWPPNHKLARVGISGATNADGAPVLITIDSIFQDEPTNGNGDASTAVDGFGVGTEVAQVRAERSGLRDGRVYYVGFTATTEGGSCPGTVTIGVPHDQGHQNHAIGQGPLYNSTIATAPVNLAESKDVDKDENKGKSKSKNK